ncbi:hypothetical protein FNV43_RR04935 [Rhamnella rubrinervis]|uniref:TORTIFOLIA1/TORL1-2 C-terminal domain-containing protein n=1 Tax=Rhamnella rubrinervis TaxID=2594499 RepID=A0A8K0HM16_9ROSA|nr:hypothetical protein FNV43_RR04935 [Rhamnella rubrinervis]
MGKEKMEIQMIRKPHLVIGIRKHPADSKGRSNHIGNVNLTTVMKHSIVSIVALTELLVFNPKQGDQDDLGWPEDRRVIQQSCRFGEGPSARSVSQASKDEATPEAIRVAGEDNSTSRTASVAIPMGDDNVVQEGVPVWTSWSNAMDALQVGDKDSAYAEVLSTGDDILLVKLMDRTGLVVEQLSNEIAGEVLHAVGQFLPEQNLFDISLSWIQQVNNS